MAVGSDDRAAYTAGVPVTLVRFLAYVLTGVLAGAAGLMLTALIGSADPNIGPSYTLIAIAAVALGGVSLAGGRGGLAGAAIGAVDIFLLQSLLTAFNVSTYVLQVAYGAILVSAVVLTALQERLAATRRPAMSGFLATTRGRDRRRRGGRSAAAPDRRSAHPRLFGAVCRPCHAGDRLAAGRRLGRPDAGGDPRRHRSVDPVRHRLCQCRRRAALRPGLELRACLSAGRSAGAGDRRGQRPPVAGTLDPPADRHAGHRNDRAGTGASVDQRLPVGIGAGGGVGVRLDRRIGRAAAGAVAGAVGGVP